MLICWKYGIWETRNAPFQFLFRSLFILHQSCLFWLKINCVGWCGHTKNFSKKSDCVSFLNYKIDFFFFPLKTKTSPATFLYATVWNYRLYKIIRLTNGKAPFRISQDLTVSPKSWHNHSLLLKFFVQHHTCNSLFLIQ